MHLIGERPNNYVINITQLISNPHCEATLTYISHPSLFSGKHCHHRSRGLWSHWPATFSHKPQGFLLRTYGILKHVINLHFVYSYHSGGASLPEDILLLLYVFFSLTQSALVVDHLLSNWLQHFILGQFPFFTVHLLSLTYFRSMHWASLTKYSYIPWLLQCFSVRRSRYSSIQAAIWLYVCFEMMA